LGPEQRALAEEILETVSGTDTLRELIQALEDGSISPDPKELGALLRHLRSDALAPLLRGAEEAEDRRIKATIQEAVRGIAKNYSEALLECLKSPDPVVVAGAASLAGKMGLSSSGPRLIKLLTHQDPRVRLASIEAAHGLKTPPILDAVCRALRDPEREVRIAAAKTLGSLRYLQAAPHLRDAIRSKGIRTADISEQIAFFESYGMIGDPEGVRLLDGLLNGRSFLGRKETGEIRACAALGLGRMGTPEAAAALERALGESDPVVRSAVNRALRGEG
jgi:HEAT repeat protein